MPPTTPYVRVLFCCLVLTGLGSTSAHAQQTNNQFQANPKKDSNAAAIARQFAEAYGRDLVGSSELETFDDLDPVLEPELTGPKNQDFQPQPNRVVQQGSVPPVGPDEFLPIDSAPPAESYYHLQPQDVAPNTLPTHEPQTPIGDIWWNQAVASPFDANHSIESVNVDLLLYAALQNSQQIQFISKDPLIRELEIVEAEAEFDPVNFARFRLRRSRRPRRQLTHDGRSSLSKRQHLVSRRRPSQETGDRWTS